MNADVVPGIGRPPKRSDYDAIVRGLKPLCDGEELLIRTSLLLMRDRAISTKPIACEAAWALLDIVDREASDAALNQRAKLDDLRELRRLCIQCVMTASGFDMLYQPRLPLEEGEANARG
jgi:hypothetical protein